MESLLPRGGFQLPFQRRLSRLYNDTKESSDFVKDPVQGVEDPGIKALHRKLRIQKDRLVSWGLEWSDPDQSAEIDQSLSEAGLGEVVGSIMSTIKDILGEAEPLWLSSKSIADVARPSSDRKPSLVQWDRGRFEDLVRDLTASIDTLYDLSRARSSGAIPRRSSKSAYKASSSADESRPFGPSRIQTPQHIDPQTLTHLKSIQGDHGDAPPKDVVFMSKTAYSELTRGTSHEPWGLLLLEYATFDSIYATTGIMPPMARFEKLSAGLQQDPQRAPGTWTGLPRLLGYFEDVESSRLGLVYRFPPSFNVLSSERISQDSLYSLPTLHDLLSRPDSEPPLEAKFRLAYNLTNTVFDMHARGITHGNLIDKNISFCHAMAKDTDVTHKTVDIRRPLVSSFDLFPEDNAVTDFPLWRRPSDPRSAQTSPLNMSTDEHVSELHMLAMILLSTGLWTRLDILAPELVSTPPDPLLDRLAVKCGSLYMKAVQACWQAADEEASGNIEGETLHSSVQVRVSRYLEACCILDGVSGLEDRLDQELHPGDSEKRHPIESFTNPKDVKSPVTLASDRKPSTPLPEPNAPQPLGKPDTADAQLDDALGKAATKSETKMRLYPHVPLSPDAVEKWNTILMPQVNQALRHFYRKHPESVEISLESVGPSPCKTQPTVLVVCTSVGKVRAILMKRLSNLFDGTTGFALKVCKGHVVRSRRQAGPAVRSMARPDPVETELKPDEVDVVNSEYQEQPGNGASIGAWIGDRHLPPVSFGGLVIVDDEPYGMTVHHMLDDPDRDVEHGENMCSSAIPDREWPSTLAERGTGDADFASELSDTELEPYSETDITSDHGDDDDDDDKELEPGDVPGIEPGFGQGYVVTQPALDDVQEGFYPCSETEDEDHLDTFSLGEVFASSGIRRKQAHGLVHEVDWALFEFAHGRLPDDNFIPRALDAASPPQIHPSKNDMAHLRPTTIAPSPSLPGMEVQCTARTSGLQTGQILPALTSVKIYGRTSPSHTYQVASMPPPAEDGPVHSRGASIGLPGDSGAWVVGRHHGQLCGHVLAWSQRKRVAYICPMDVLLLDIAQTLRATEVRLPGGEPFVTIGDSDDGHGLGRVGGGGVEGDQDLVDLVEKKLDEDGDGGPPPPTERAPSATRLPGHMSPGIHSRSISNAGSSAPIRLETSSEIQGLTSMLEDFGLGRSQRIGVS